MIADDLATRLEGLSPAKRKLLFERLRSRAAEREPDEAMPRAPRDADLPLSFGQRQLWLIDQLAPGSPRYNVPVAAALDGDLDVPALRSSLSQVVARHEALRTRFEQIATGEPRQVIEEPAPITLPVVDLSALPTARQEAEAARAAGLEHGRPFDLGRAPMLCAVLLRLGRRRHALLLTLHHIAADGWSIGVLMGDLAAFYAARTAGRPPALPALPAQYADFAWHQRRRLQGERLDSLIAWWRERLTPPPPPLTLPFDRPRPAFPSGRGGRRLAALSPRLLPALARTAEACGATSFMVLLAAFQALLARLTGQEAVTVGTPVAGRDRPETEGLIGYFVNTLALRTDVVGDPPFDALLDRVRETALAAFAHAEIPFELLVEALQPERSPAMAPFFQILFALQNAPAPRLEVPSLTLKPLDLGGFEGAKFDLSFSLVEEEGGMTAVALYSRDLFDGTTIQRLLGHYAALLEGAIAGPGRRVSELPLLSAAERQQLAREWNDTAAPSPERCVHELFEEQVDRGPGRIAVEDRGTEVTYEQLDRRANRLANRLRALGVESEGVVALLLEPSADLIAAVLGVLKAGGAYLPLDPAYPHDRLAWMLADSGAQAVVTAGDLARKLRAAVQVLRVEDVACEPAARPCVAVDLDHPAYVLYTSGSTGRPKGTAVSHRSLLNYLAALQGGALGPVRPLPLLASLSFDASVKQLFTPLMRGGAVWIPRAGATAEPRELLAEIASRPGAALNCVPALWRALLDLVAAGGQPPPHLSALFLGGDALDQRLVERTLAALPGLEVWNLYGPTEVTVNASFARLSAGETTIGRPIENARLLVLGRHLELLPLGVAGELLVGGLGLARGYLGRPELTAERFIPDPFADLSGERLYRTGDLVRTLADGRLDFLGRRDGQVKVRGFRIEPGEIEAALMEHPAVRECAVAMHGSEDRRLVAYVAPGAGSGATPAELRGFLAQRLPAYMVPAGFLTIAALPRTPSGKLDRRALAGLAGGAEALRSAPYSAPRTDLEERLAAIWREVLGAERVGIHDSFFELGGHSLAAVRLAARARQEGIALDMGQIFRAPTVAALAAEIAAAAGPQTQPVAGPQSPAPDDFPDAELGAADLQRLLARLGGHGEQG